MAQTEQSLASTDERGGEGRVEGSQVANPVGPGETAALAPLPIEETDLPLGVYEDVFGVQVPMHETGCVQPSEGRAQTPSQSTTRGRRGPGAKPGGQVHRVGHVSDQQERTTVFIFAKREPLGRWEPFPLERLQRSCFPETARNEAEPRQGIGQSNAPANPMVALEEPDAGLLSTAEDDARDVAIRMAAYDDLGQTEERARMKKSQSPKERTVMRMHLDEGPAPPAPADDPQGYTQEKTTA
jgi:hypothetical protein